MSREHFRIAIVVILAAFLFCYYKTTKYPTYPKYLPFERLGGVIECDTGMIIAFNGTYTPTIHGLKFQSMEDSEKEFATPQK
jgi:hypothetical protein